MKEELSPLSCHAKIEARLDQNVERALPLYQNASYKG